MNKKILFSNISFSLIILLLGIGSPLFSQSKKELVTTVDSLNNQIGELKADRDSLSTQLGTLQSQTTTLRDSLSGEIKTYQGFYVYIRDNYFPENAKVLALNDAMKLIDSLSTARDSSMLNLANAEVVLADSLARLKKTNDSLAIENKAFKNVLDLLASDKRYPRKNSDFLGEWKLFLVPITLTGAPPQTGLVSLEQVTMPDSLYFMMLERIDFQADDLADLYFADGQLVKCFFKINDFNPQATYTVDLDRGKDIDIRLFITHVPKGLQVSYEVPQAQVSDGARRYYFGYMRL